MKIEIKSNQIFEDHVDSIREEHDSEINYFDNGFEISYDGCILKLVDEKVLIKRKSMDLQIELQKRTSNIFKTPYGMLDMEVEGKSISWNREPFHFEVKYLIKLGNTCEYMNELEIVVLNK